MKKIIELVNRLIRKQPRSNLREKCIEEYGKEFGELYDNINRGIPIGGFTETLGFIKAIESVKEKYGIR